MKNVLNYYSCSVVYIVYHVSASRSNPLNLFTRSHKFIIHTLKSKYNIYRVNDVNTTIIQHQTVLQPI